MTKEKTTKLQKFMNILKSCEEIEEDVEITIQDIKAQLQASARKLNEYAIKASEIKNLTFKIETQNTIVRQTLGEMAYQVDRLGVAVRTTVKNPNLTSSSNSLTTSVNLTEEQVIQLRDWLNDILEEQK